MYIFPSFSRWLAAAASRSPSYDLPRSAATFVFASAQHTSQIGSRATLYPTLVCTAATGRVVVALDRGMQRVAETRACYTPWHLSLSAPRRAALLLLPGSFPLSLYRLSWSSVHASPYTVDTSLCYLDTPQGDQELHVEYMNHARRAIDKVSEQGFRLSCLRGFAEQKFHRETPPIIRPARFSGFRTGLPQRPSLLRGSLFDRERERERRKNFPRDEFN